MSLAMEKATSLLAKIPPMKVDMEKIKSPQVQMAAAGVVGTLTAVQLFTEWDPIGRCLRFWKQLNDHVSFTKTDASLSNSDVGRKCHTAMPTDGSIVANEKK